MLRQHKGEIIDISQNNTMVAVKGLKMFFPIIRGLFRRKIGGAKVVKIIPGYFFPLPV
jgi:hypothetical protein